MLLMLIEQFNWSIPGSFTLTITDCSVLLSNVHPLQLQLSSLLDGGVGSTIHVKVRSDPTGNSKTFSIPLTGMILVIRLALYSATAKAMAKVNYCYTSTDKTDGLCHKGSQTVSTLYIS